MKQKNWKTQALSTIIVSMVTFLLFNFLTTVSLNIFIPAVAELKNMSTATLYNANTVGNLISVFFALSVGTISKKLSLKALTVTGLFIGGISYILIPLVPNEMTGIFIATNYIATMFYAQITVGARIGNWYPVRKGEILGIATDLTISSLVLLPLFSKATETFGIADSMIFAGGLVVLLGIVGIFVIKDRPQDVGLYPENMSKEEYESKLGESITEEDTTWNYSELLKNHKFVLFSLGWGFCMPGMMGLSVAIIPIMMSKGVSPTQAVAIAAFAGVFQFIGGIASGFMDTRIGQRFTINVFLLLEVFGLILFSFIPENHITLLIMGYYVIMFMMGAPNNLQPSSYLTLAGGGGKTFMVFYSLATAIASVVRGMSSSILVFSTENYNGSYTPAMLIFLAGCILSIILINLFGFKRLEKRA